MELEKNRTKITISSKDANAGQNVSFINVVTDNKVIELPINQIGEKKYGIILNNEFGDGRGIASLPGYTGFSALYKQEVKINGPKYNEKQEITDFDYTPLTKLMPVDTGINTVFINDYNVGNNRIYRYVLYPLTAATSEEFVKSRYSFVFVNWSGWSITELHKSKEDPYLYLVESPNDTWIFNLNVDIGEYTQNIVRNEQQTLGQFNRYSDGRTNYVSGSVNCLLGRDVLPASYEQINKYSTTLSDGTYSSHTTVVNTGGYAEGRTNISGNETSNTWADMMIAWRKFVKSPNPKLLRDRSGQIFIVTINSSSNSLLPSAGRQPNQISFTWTQIDDASKYKIASRQTGEV